MTLNANQDNVTSILDQYRAKPKPTEPPAPIGAAGPLYRAYSLETQQKKSSLIAIYFSNEQKSLIQKSFLKEALFTSHQNITLFFPHCVIAIEGKHLDQLFVLLQDEKILALHCFDPKIHEKPGEDEIMITRIERRSPNETFNRKDR